MSYVLKLNKEYFEDETVTPLEMLLLAQIDEFLRNTGVCNMSDETFANQFHVSTQTVQRALASLEKRNFIKRNTVTTSDNGRATRYRTLTLDTASKSIKQPKTNINKPQTTKQSKAARLRTEQKICTGVSEIFF